MAQLIVSGNATASQVLTGSTFSAGVLNGASGTMPNNGAVTITPSNVNQTIAGGYHNGSGNVPAVVVPATNVLTGITIAGTAGTMPNNGAVNRTPSNVAQSIPAGYTTGGTVGAVTFTTANVLTGTTIAGTAGTMPNNGAPTYTPSTGNQGIGAGYYSGGTVLGDSDLVPTNIRTGINIFGIIGTLIPGRLVATGTSTSANSQAFTVTGLAFQPRMIIVIGDSSGSANLPVAVYISSLEGIFASDTSFRSSGSSGVFSPSYFPSVVNGGFSFDNLTIGGTTYKWIAVSG